VAIRPESPDVMPVTTPDTTVRAGESCRGGWLRGGEHPLLWRRPHLTEREARVLELVATGLPTRDIAARLFVSRQAVTYHIGNLLAKFQTTNRAGLVARAYVLGALTLSWPPRTEPSTEQAGQTLQAPFIPREAAASR
jgi:DNA-binding CsgD family transcriptional regulator